MYDQNFVKVIIATKTIHFCHDNGQAVYVICKWMSLGCLLVEINHRGGIMSLLRQTHPVKVRFFNQLGPAELTFRPIYKNVLVLK